jgi:hypothetical protein
VEQRDRALRFSRERAGDRQQGFELRRLAHGDQDAIV